MHICLQTRFFIKISDNRKRSIQIIKKRNPTAPCLQPWALTGIGGVSGVTGMTGVTGVIGVSGVGSNSGMTGVVGVASVACVA